MSNEQLLLSEKALSIPVIDVREHLEDVPGGTDRAAAELRVALEQVGFFVITGHGVDWAMVDTAYAQAKRLFDLPDKEKQTIAIPGTFADKYGKRGYMGFTDDAYGSTRATNRIESFYFGLDDAHNRWPAELDGFQNAMLTYLQTVNQLAFRLLPIYARALGLDREFFASYFQDPATSFRAAHYPPNDKPGMWGLMPHTDRAFLTVLPMNDVGGLQIRPEGSEWIDAPQVAEAFIINSGDTLRRWTNDRFLSTPHRVLPPTKDRYSLPYFYSPSPDKVMEQLSSCVSGSGTHYKAIKFDVFYREYFSPDYRPNDPRLSS